MAHFHCGTGDVSNEDVEKRWERTDDIRRAYAAVPQLTERERPGALFAKLLRIGVWSEITGQLAMKPSLSLRTVVTERKTKEGRDQSHSEGAEREREEHKEVIYGL